MSETSAAGVAPARSSASPAPGTRLRGRWLLLARWLAALICALCLILTATGTAIEILNRATGRSGTGIYPGSYAIALLFPTVGALIIWWRPGNPIGWVFCGMGLSECITALTQPYVYYALVARPGSLPAAALASWVDVWVWIPGFALITYLLLLFPTGRLLSEKWRPIAWLAAINLGLSMLVPALTSWSRRGLYVVTHPDGVVLSGPFALLSDLSSVLLYGTLLASIISLVLRFRRSRGMERQQLKWFTYAAVLAALALAATILVNPGGGYLNGNLLNDATAILQFLGFAAIPSSVGVAILRYQLFDIDILINRTLVYGALTAILVAVYFGSVVLMQRLATALALAGRQSGSNSVIIVLSTLLIAALFTPLRTHLQRTIDRRFYRGKYDAAKTLERFAATLRSETDLTSLTEHVVATVEETMQPAQAWLWLREPPHGRAQ